MKTLVVGLGNPIVSDDGAGIKVVQVMKGKVHHPDVDMVEVSAGGLDLLDLIVGYEKLILIDATRTPGGVPGSFFGVSLNDLGSTNHLCSPHDIGFKELIQLGRKLGLNLPHEIFIYAIEADDITTFDEQCTPAIAKTIPQLVDLIIEEQLDRS